MRLAEAGIEELAAVVDTLIVIPNQNLFRVATEKTTFADAFKMADDVLHGGVRSITDLMLRGLYLIGEMSGQHFVDLLHLPYDNVIDQGIAYLRREQMCEIKGSGGIGEKAYRYQATSKGVERAKEIGERTQYLGPAPVPLDAYSDVMRRQTTQGLIVNEDAIRQAFAHLVINDALLQLIAGA